MSNPFAPGESQFSEQEPEIKPANFREIGKAAAQGVVDAWSWEGIKKYLPGFLTELLATAFAMWVKATGPLARILANGIIKGEEDNEEEYARLGALGVKDLFGVDVPIESMLKKRGQGQRIALAQQLGKGVVQGLFPAAAAQGGQEMKPSSAGAENLVGKMIEFSMQDWFMGWSAELTTLHYLENFGELGDTVSKTLGFERLTSRCLRPFADIAVTKPLEWQLNKTFRPELLSPSQVATQYHRGKMTAEQVKEELARQGYSDQRIEAILNANTKMLGVADLAWLVRYGSWTRDQAIAHLRDQGWDEDLALAQLEIERLKRLDTLQNQYVGVVADAYARRDIDHGTFADLVAHSALEPEIQEMTIKVAALKRELSIKEFSESDAEQAVKRGIWLFNQYRALLAKLGYSPDDIISKELLLRDEIQTAADADRARQQLLKERAQEKATKLQAARDRQAQLEYEQTHQEIGLADAKRAYVSGILSREQYQGYLDRNHIIAEDQGVLLELADQDRDDYIAQQDKRRQAESKLAKQNISLSQLERAVKQSIVAMGTYREALIARGFEEGDVDILVGLLQNDIAADQAAEAARAEAKAKLENIGVNLSQEEEAVLAGIDTIGDYRQFLIFHKFTPEAVETLVALMRSKLADRAAALQKRAEAEAKLAQKKISLADVERAVRLGFRTMAEYRQRLQAEGFSVDDVTTLVNLLQETINEDAAKAARKAELEAKLEEKNVSLADVERAVKLGIRGIDTYKAALVEAELPADDQQLLIDLLVEDMRLAAAARAKREQIDAELSKKKVSLSQFEQLVKKGIRSVDEYETFLVSNGYSRDDADLLAELMELELEELDAARDRRRELDQMTEFREVSRRDLENGVRAGLVQVPTYRQWLRDHEYSERDVELLENLILLELFPEASE